MMNTTPSQPETNLDSPRLRRREKDEVDRWFDTFADPVYTFIFYRVGEDTDLAGYGELNVVPKLDTAHPDRVSFDLSLLGLSLAELEKSYFVTP